MSFAEASRKELRVIAYGQSARFRIVKYAIILPLLGAIYYFKGWAAMWWTVGIGAILGIVVHFIFRRMTKGWTTAWFLFKPLDK